MTTNRVKVGYAKIGKKKNKTKSKTNFNSSRKTGMNNLFYRRLANKVGRLARLGNTECKFVNTSGTATPSTTYVAVLLNPLSQGTGMLNRIGNSIRAFRLELNIKYTISGVANNSSVRVLVLTDKQPNNALLDNPYSSTTLVSQFDPAFMYRYIIHKQWVKSYSITGIQESYDSNVFNLDYHVRFSNNLGTIADISTNALWLLMTSDETVNTPSVQYDARFSYIDD